MIGESLSVIIQGDQENSQMIKKFVLFSYVMALFKTVAWVLML